MLAWTGTTTGSVCQHLHVGLSPSDIAAGQGVWEGSLFATVVTAEKCKALMQGARWSVKQNLLWSREELTVKEKLQVGRYLVI